MASHPDDHLLQLFGERPAILVTDPNTAGVYDTVYVDLDDDYQFGDEKPVTKESPASYRDMNGDGYNDLSGGLLYFISDGETVLPGGIMRFTDGSQEFRDAFTVRPGRDARLDAATTTRRSRGTARSPRPTSSARASSTASRRASPTSPAGRAHSPARAAERIPAPSSAAHRRRRALRSATSTSPSSSRRSSATCSPRGTGST